MFLSDQRSRVTMHVCGYDEVATRLPPYFIFSNGTYSISFISLNFRDKVQVTSFFNVQIFSTKQVKLEGLIIH